MRLNMNKYPISFFCEGMLDINWGTPQKRVAEWRDLGITLAMLNNSTPDQKDLVLEFLDECEKNGIKLIIRDIRTHWDVYKELGADGYKETFKTVLSDFGNHPAIYGFYIGDEPRTDDYLVALECNRIQLELAPQFNPYINFLPWVDGTRNNMNFDSIEEYLDYAITYGESKLISYDCYRPFQEKTDSYWDDYFSNLNAYAKATIKHRTPFMNIVLSAGHSCDEAHYRCPNKDEMRWLLGTSVATGAASVSWYVIEPVGVFEYNYRNLPINRFGERTEEFNWLSEVNREFLARMGDVMHSLNIEEFYHVKKSYGGADIFKPFGKLKKTSGKQSLIVSRFSDSEGGEYYMVCLNSMTECDSITLTFEKGTEIEVCVWGNEFKQVNKLVDEAGYTYVNFRLEPGGLKLFKVSK